MLLFPMIGYGIQIFAGCHLTLCVCFLRCIWAFTGITMAKLALASGKQKNVFIQVMAEPNVL